MSLQKVRVQLLNETTGAVEQEVDVLTSAECVTFADGQTFQDKLNAGILRGPQGTPGANGTNGAPGVKGDKGDQGVQGIQGVKGDKGLTGDKGDTGAKGISCRLKGAWASGVAYVSDASYIDLVTSGGQLYMCIKAHTSSSSILVTNTTYWSLVAQKGSNGINGTNGAPGAKGDKGDPGDTVKVGTSLGSATQKKLFFKIV